MLEKILKYQLKQRESKSYLQWLAERDQIRTGHHILGKRNDFLIAKIMELIHKKVHAKTNDAPSFEELLVNALENLMDYTEHLEKKLENR